MRICLALAAAVCLTVAAGPSLAQVQLPAVLPSADQWRDMPALAPGVTDPETRQQMNDEIVQAIADADGDQDAARQAVTAIATRYQEIYGSQGARSRPSPK